MDLAINHPGVPERSLSWRGPERSDLQGVRNITKGPAGGRLDQAITGGGIYKLLKRYGALAGVTMDGLCLHALRATAATNALEHQADIASVQMWLEHSSIATTKLYDRRRSRPEGSPTFKVRY